MESMFLNGINYHYLDSAPGDNDRPLAVLIPGFPLTSAMWEPQWDFLHHHGYRVVAPDLRGLGETPLGDVDYENPALHVHADDIIALLAHCSATAGRVTLIGLSMGGYIMFPLLRKLEKQGRADWIARLAFLDTRATLDTPEGRSDRFVQANRIDALLSENPNGNPLAAMAEEEGCVPFTGRLLGPTAKSKRPELSQFLEKTVLDCGAKEPRGVAWSLRAMGYRESGFDTLTRVTAPTVVIVGRDDVVTPPAESQTIVAALPPEHATYIEIPDAGHMANLENPDAVNAALHPPA